MVVKSLLKACFPALFPLYTGGGGGGGKAPKPQNPATIATAQNQQNTLNAQQQAYWNRIDETTPYGSISYDQDWKSPTAQAEYNQALQNYQNKKRNADTYWAQGGDGYSAKQVQKYWKDPSKLYAHLGIGAAPDVAQYQQTNKRTTLDPRLQKILEQQWDVQSTALGAAQDYAPIVEQSLSQPIPEYGEERFRGQGNAQMGEFAGEGQYKANLPVADEAYRNKIEEALWGRLNPQVMSEKTRLNEQLINQGLRPGGEAWKKAKLDQAQEINDLRLGVTGAGAQELAKQYARELAGYESGRATKAQNFGNRLSAYEANRATKEQNFQNLLAKWTANQSERQNVYGSQLAKRGLPLQELSSILGMSQGAVQMPQSTIGGTIDVGSPTNMAQLYQNMYNQQADQYNLRAGQGNANLQAGMGAAGSAVGIAVAVF